MLKSMASSTRNGQPPHKLVTPKFPWCVQVLKLHVVPQIIRSNHITRHPWASSFPSERILNCRTPAALYGLLLRAEGIAACLRKRWGTSPAFSPLPPARIAGTAVDTATQCALLALTPASPPFHTVDRAHPAQGLGRPDLAVPQVEERADRVQGQRRPLLQGGWELQDVASLGSALWRNGQRKTGGRCCCCCCWGMHCHLAPACKHADHHRQTWHGNHHALLLPQCKAQSESLCCPEQPC